MAFSGSLDNQRLNYNIAVLLIPILSYTLEYQ